MTQPPEYPPPSDPNEPSSAPPPPPPSGQEQPPAYPGGASYPPPPPPAGEPAPPYGQQPYQQPYGQQSYYQETQPGQGGMNGLAIAALVVGFFCWPLGYIFGGVALSQIKKKNQKGRGLAIAGLVLSTIGLIGSIAYVAGAFDEAGRDDSGAITDKGDVDTIDLREGDCVNGIKAETTMVSVEGVPCTQPHEGEVYAVIKLDDGDFPGNDALSKQAERQCPARLESGHPEAWKDQAVGVFYLQPTADSWKIGDHSITCLATTEQKRTGSIDD